MHHFQSTPNSTQKVGTGPPSPPHFYNYTKENRRKPMQKAARQPQTIHNTFAANALREDNTIENVNKGTPSPLTLLLIGLIALVLLAGLIGGGFFLFRHGKNNKVDSLPQKTEAAPDVDTSRLGMIEKSSGSPEKENTRTTAAAPLQEQPTTVHARLGTDQIYDQDAQQYNYRLRFREAVSSDESEEDCDQADLARFYFLSLAFTLTKQPKNGPVEIWNCNYQFTDTTPQHRLYSRRILSDSSGSGNSYKTAKEKSSGEPFGGERPDVVSLHSPRGHTHKHSAQVHTYKRPQIQVDSTEQRTAATIESHEQPDNGGSRYPQMEIGDETAPRQVSGHSPDPHPYQYSPPVQVQTELIDQRTAATDPGRSSFNSLVTNKIYLTMKWWDEILNNHNTQCTMYTTLYPSRPKTPCSIVNKRKVSTRSRRRLRKGDWYMGCDLVWLANEEQQTLSTQRSDVDASRFLGILLQTAAEGDRDRRIYLGRLPWECELFSGKTVSESSEESSDEGLRRRSLMAGKDTSNAWNKDNMYMIIGSTIFFIVIGVQSFYWLSHSY